MDKFCLITTSQSTPVRRLVHFEMPSELVFLPNIGAKSIDEKFFFAPFLECVKRLTMPKVASMAPKKRKPLKKFKNHARLPNMPSEGRNLQESLAYSIYLTQLIRVVSGKEVTFGRGRWPGLPVPIVTILFTASSESSFASMNTQFFPKLAPSDGLNQLLPYAGPLRWDQRLIIFNLGKENITNTGYLSKLMPVVFNGCSSVNEILQTVESMFSSSPIYKHILSKGILVELKSIDADSSLPEDKYHSHTVRFITVSDKESRWPFPEDYVKDLKKVVVVPNLCSIAKRDSVIFSSRFIRRSCIVA